LRVYCIIITRCILIDSCIGHINGDPVAARPSKIVSGHEAEKTNEILQLLGKLCLEKVTITSLIFIF